MGFLFKVYNLRDDFTVSRGFDSATFLLLGYMGASGVLGALAL